LAIGSARELTILTMKWREPLLVLGLVALYLFSATHWQGISLYDDSLYLTLGRSFHLIDFWRGASYAPLYTLWIKLVSLVVHDPVHCYMASWALLVVLVATIPLWMRLRYAWAYTFVLVALPFFSVGPYVSLYAALFLVSGLCIVVERRLALPSALCATCVVCFLVAFIRPEFEFALYIATFLLIPALLIATPRASKSAAVLQVLVVLLLCIGLRVVMVHQHSMRSGIAFAQHFNYRAWKLGLLGHADPFASNYAERMFNIDLQHTASDTTATIGDYFRANPRLFTAHILANLHDPRTFLPVLSALAVALLPWWIDRYRALRPAGSYLLVVCLPVMVSMIAIYPRAHYPIIIFPAILLLALQLLPRRFSTGSAALWLALPLGVVCIRLVNTHREQLRPDLDTNLRSNVTTIACIRDLERSAGAGNGKLLDTHTVRFDDVYFLLPHTRIYEPNGPSWPSFMMLVQQQRPSWIIEGPAMPAIYGQDLATIAHFLVDEMGYTAHPCPPETGVTLYTLTTP
jgi:hypothetical protein